VSDLRVFIYGSLLPGCVNHHVIQDAKCLGTALTKPEFDLIDLGEYPALVQNGSTQVHGRLYVIDDALLHRLDEFEDHPDLYQRLEIALEGGEMAQTYVFPRENLWSQTVVSSGNWLAYLQSRKNVAGN